MEALIGTHIAFVFPSIPGPSAGSVPTSPLSGKPCGVLSLGRISDCLVVMLFGESLLYTLIMNIMIIAIFSKLSLQFIISPSVPPFLEGEQVEQV